MGCGSCGSGGSSPLGCKNNGGCSSGSCNRMNAYDWLNNLVEIDNDNTCRVIEISFNNGSRKDFFRNNTVGQFYKGDMVTVESATGFDVGQVNLTGEIVRLQMKKRNIVEHNPDMKKVLRIANEFDIQKLKENKAKEPELLIRSRAIAKQLKLEMKIAEVEMQADGKKATFFYIADDRVDFRELIKVYAAEFKVKIEMRQIGARQEAGKVGGVGSCGRELCCSSWLSDFKSVNTVAARYQSLSINQSKLSGQCGRLKCCLNYELDTYLDALQYFPNNADTIEFAKGRAYLVKKDIFRNLMWFQLEDSTSQIPLTIEKVKEIIELNKKGIKPDEVEKAEVVTKTIKEIEADFGDLAAQTSLKSIERSSKKKRDKERAKQQNQEQQNQNKKNHNNKINNNTTQVEASDKQIQQSKTDANAPNIPSSGFKLKKKKKSFKPRDNNQQGN